MIRNRLESGSNIREDVCVHEGDSTLFMRLAMRCSKINQTCRALLEGERPDEEAVEGLIEEEQEIHADMLRDRKITREQVTELGALMEEGLPPRSLIYQIPSDYPPSAA